MDAKLVNFFVKLALIVLIGVCAVPALAQYDREWVGTSLQHDWNNANFWDPTGVPEAGEDILIHADFPADITVEIYEGDSAAECESITIDGGAKLKIIGNSLTIGDDNNPTTTTIDDGSQIQFLEGENEPAVLYVRNWVSFTGNGRLFAHGPDNADYRPVIHREDSYSDSGIKTLDDFNVRGHLTLLVSVYHDGDEFGVWSEKNLMIFGDNTDVFDPDLEISGASLNDETFTAYYGKIRFVQMEFDSTAPKWFAAGGDIGGGTFHGTIETYAQRNNVPNDIDLESYSILNVFYDLTFNGNLHMHDKPTKVRVEDGAAATFVAP